MRLAPQTPHSSSHTLEHRPSARLTTPPSALDAARCSTRPHHRACRRKTRASLARRGGCHRSWLTTVKLAAANKWPTLTSTTASRAHCDLMSNQPTGQPKPADSPFHAPTASESSNPVRSLSSIAKGREMIDWWTSSTLLCALFFALSVLYAFNGKAGSAHSFMPCCCTLLRLLPLPPAPCVLLPAPRVASARSTYKSSALCTHRTGSERKTLKC